MSPIILTINPDQTRSLWQAE